MSFQLIIGGSGSGKTTYIYDRLIEDSMKQPTKTFIIIVPEQFTLKTQQDIIERHPRHGIMNIEVLSFNRLAYRIIEDLDIINKTMLKDTGKGMVIRKLIENEKDRYKILSANCNRKGYIKDLLDIIIEFYQYNINNDTLDEIINKIDSQLLGDKFSDLKLLFNSYKNFLENKYVTTESTIELLLNRINDSTLLKRSEIYIDGFYGFTPIQYKLISKLMSTVLNLKVSVTIDSSEQFNDVNDESELFYESKKVINKLIEIANEKNIIIEKNLIINDKQPKRYKNDYLIHLQKNLYRYPYKIYKKVPTGLFLCEASNIKEEVAYVADSIMNLLTKYNYRFKDIAILSGDLNGYEEIIKETLNNYNIPYFIDKKKSIITHPLVELIESSLEIIINNFDYNSVFRYFKSGLLNISKEDIDLLENYVLSYGIRGEKKWKEYWEKPYPLITSKDNENYLNEIMIKINDIKTELITPIFELKNSVSGNNKSVEDITKALINFFEKLNILSKIQKMEDEFKENGLLTYQKEYEQIYKLVIDVFEQIVIILKNKKITIKEYAKLLSSGLEQCEMGLVPPAIDQIVVGDLDRTRINEVRALFVIGFNEGKVPRVSEKAKLLTDMERTKLKQLGISLAPNNKENLYKEQFSIYMALLRSSEKLFISFSKLNFDGSSIRPSMLFYNIKKMFIKVKVLTTKDLYLKRLVINKPKPTFTNIIKKINECNNIEDLKQIKDAYLWFYKQNEWKNKINILEEAINKINNEIPLDEKDTVTLYGMELSNSVSRLESFSKCPFLHFIDYGLKLKKRPEFMITMPDIGILFHKVLDRFSKKLNIRGIDWKELDDENIEILIYESVNEIINEERTGIYFSSYRNKYLINRLTRIAKRAVWAIRFQIAKGNFKPIDYEYAFEGSDANALTIDFDNGRSMKLKGQIDRVDGFEEEDTVYLTIVDYKSGNKNIDMVALYYGLQLQLFIYLKAAVQIKEKTLNKKVIPAGVFYFHINDPIIKKVSSRDFEYIEKEIKKQLKLKGIVLNEKEIIKQLDSSLNRYSDVIPVSFTSTGEIAKSSSVVSRQQFDELQKYVIKKAKDIGKDIISGNISINPYKRKNNTSCDYCDYLSICQFENGICGNQYRYLDEFNKDEIFNKISYNNKDSN